MGYYLIAFIVISVLSFFALQKFKEYKRGKERELFLNTRSDRFVETQYRCVVIESGLTSCPASKNFSNKPILMEHAPTLPLPLCNQTAECECKFTRHNDRRQDSRRTPYGGAAFQIAAKADKREKNGRRAEDLE